MSTYAFLVPTEDVLAKRQDTNARYAAALEVWNGPSQKHEFRSSMAGHLVNDVHAMFRNWFHGLKNRVMKKRSEAETTNEDLIKWFDQEIRPRFVRALQSLEGHHRGEDTQWFPMMVRDHPKTKAAFAVLEEDHRQLHPIERVVTESPRDATLADKLNAVVEFADFLEDHLRREEMLVVPLLLRGGAHSC